MWTIIQLFTNIFTRQTFADCEASMGFTALKSLQNNHTLPHDRLVKALSHSLYTFGIIKAEIFEVR